MNIHLSTATVHAYENRRQSMNLHYNPIVFFENSWPFSTRFLQEINWRITAPCLGSLDFEIVQDVDSPFAVRDDRNYIQFHLSLSDVPFQYDPYECELHFTAKLTDGIIPETEINFSSWGIVKTKWEKGLQ